MVTSSSVGCYEQKGLHFMPPGICLLQKEVCNFCKTKKHFFLLDGQKLKRRGEEYQLGNVCCDFHISMTIFQKTNHREHSRVWGCVSNSALWVLPSCPFFSGTRQAKGYIFTHVSLVWEGFISWGRYVGTNRSYVSVSETHPSCFTSKCGELLKTSLSQSADGHFKAAAGEHSQGHRYLSREQAQHSVDVFNCYQSHLDRSSGIKMYCCNFK